MKEVKKVLGAALAATLTTGIVGTVAGATTVDDLYKAAYDATLDALNKKDQDSINAAREAINKLPRELQGFKGEFSKQVDTVQHPILVTIVNAINNADKTLKQVDINTANKAIPANLPAEWRNSYSSGLDAVQQKLIVKADEAAKKAEKSQVKADVDAAIAMLSEIANVENNDGVKNWVTTYEKEFKGKIKITVSSIEVVNNDTIKVNFTKEVDAKTVTNRVFTTYETESKKSFWASTVKVSEDKKSVEVKFDTTFATDKNVTLEVKDLKDLNGNVMEASKGEFVYTKAEVNSIKLTKTTVTPGTDLTKYLVITDQLGRDVTKTTKFEFQSSNLDTVKENGATDIAGQAKVVIVVKVDGKEVAKSEAYTINVEVAKANELEGITVYEKDADISDLTYNKIENKVQYVKIESAANKLALFFKDQYGNARTALKATDVEEVTNLNQTVANLGKDLVINTVSTGKATFKIKVKGIENPVFVSVDVKAKAKPETMTLDNSQVLLATSGVAKDLKLQVKDQYGDSVEVKTSEVVVTVKNDAGDYVATDADKATVATVSAPTQDGNNVKLTVTPQAVAGNNSYRVTYKTTIDEKEVQFTKDFTVDVKTAGNGGNYKIDKKVTSLDLFDTNTKDDKDPTNDSFQLYELDNNNREINKISTAKATIEIVNKNNEIVGCTDESKEKVDNFEITYDAAKGYTISSKATTKAKVEDYTVKVKVGSLVVETYTLSVKDSARTATTLTFDAFSVKNEELGLTYNVSSLVTVVDQYGDKVDFTVLGNTATAVSPKKTNETSTGYELVISTVSVKIDGGNTNEVKLAEPVIVKVSLK